MSVQPIQPQDYLPAQRPAKATQRARSRKQQVMDADSVGIRVDGRDYVINPHDLTGRIERDIRNEIGMGLAELQARLEVSPGLDYLGMFMWAVRYAQGEDPDLEEILDNLHADADFVVLKEKDLAASAGPKASARKSSPRSRPSRPSSA